MRRGEEADFLSEEGDVTVGCEEKEEDKLLAGLDVGSAGEEDEKDVDIKDEGTERSHANNPVARGGSSLTAATAALGDVDRKGFLFRCVG